MDEHTRDAPISDVESGKPLTLEIVLDASTADWVLRLARMNDTTPEAVIENAIEAMAQNSANQRASQSSR